MMAYMTLWLCSPPRSFFCEKTGISDSVEEAGMVVLVYVGMAGVVSSDDEAVAEI